MTGQVEERASMRSPPPTPTRLHARSPDARTRFPRRHVQVRPPRLGLGGFEILFHRKGFDGPKVPMGLFLLMFLRISVSSYLKHALDGAREHQERRNNRRGGSHCCREGQERLDPGESPEAETNHVGSCQPESTSLQANAPVSGRGKAFRRQGNDLRCPSSPEGSSYRSPGGRSAAGGTAEAAPHGPKRDGRGHRLLACARELPRGF